jgi:hypothetical protein
VSDDVFVFTEETNIFEALLLGPEVREVFRRLGLKCVKKEQGAGTDYCIAAEREPLRMAGLYHDQDIRAILNALNALRVKPLTPEEKEKGGR